MTSLIPQPPPPNGRKLWRVQRQLTPNGHTSNEHNPTQQCLQNSLKIVAAGKAFLTKRPPLKRPKNKPGKPKDFVFVDLSPVRSEESSSDESNKRQKSASVSSESCMISPPNSAYLANVSPFSEAQETFSVSSDDESLFSLYETTSQQQDSQFLENYETSQMPEIGLGINVLDNWQFDYNFGILPQQEQEQAPVYQHKRVLSTPATQSVPSFATPNKKRSASASFEYTTPSPKKQELGLEAFMMFNDQFNVSLPQQTPKTRHYTIPRSVNNAADAYSATLMQASPQTPSTSVSDFEEENVMKLGKPIEFQNSVDFNQSMFFLKQNDFDLSAFVSF